jgi:glycosyltransferase involved in cell wall biosynthesis
MKTAELHTSSLKGKKLPKLSIVMPCFNQSKYIERSIKSIIEQKYENLELIVVDGGSKDGTLDIIKKYQSNIHYCISEPDMGQSDALNKGFAIASGDIFGWLNSDDLYCPEAFNKAVSVFNVNPNCSVVFGDWVTIDIDDNLITREYAFDFNLNHFKYEGFHLNSQAMFWRKKVHHRFGKFDQSLYNTMDYQMILSFGINEGEDKFVRINGETLAAFRRHPEQKTKDMDARVISEHKALALTYSYDDKYRISGKIKNKVFRIRRFLWYIKRGGLYYCLKQINKSKFRTVKKKISE